jgi:hypothetical protein
MLAISAITEITVTIAVRVAIAIVVVIVITKLPIKTCMKGHESYHRYCIHHPALPRRLETMQGSCNLNASAECS